MSTVDVSEINNDDDFELVRGSGNVFRDLGHPNPEVLQLKAILAAKIIDVLDKGKITSRRAHEMTGFAAADFSRIRNARLARFTIERMMTMLDRLNQDVHIRITVESRLTKTRNARNGGVGI